jgi:hypothetical protein
MYTLFICVSPPSLRRVLLLSVTICTYVATYAFMSSCLKVTVLYLNHWRQQITFSWWNCTNHSERCEMLVIIFNKMFAIFVSVWDNYCILSVLNMVDEHIHYVWYLNFSQNWEFILWSSGFKIYIHQQLGGTTYLHILRVEVSKFNMWMSYTGSVAWIK